MSQRCPLYRQHSPFAEYIAGDVPLDSPELFKLKDELKAFLYELNVEADTHAATIDMLRQVLATAESEADTTPHGNVVAMILRAALTAAQSEHAAARACCDAHASILPTPIHILPVEIMAKIFYLIVPPLSHGPWWLMHVCRRWRSILTSYPILWSSFSIPAPRVHRLRRDPLINEEPLNEELLVQILEYSYPAPLTFHANVHHLSVGLLPEFSLSSPRWRNVSLDQCMALDLEESLILPVLEDLTLCDSDTGFTPIILNLFTQTPSLTRLSLGGTAADQALFPGDADLLIQITSNFPWSQITDLSVALDYSWMSYLFLSACPNLVSFRDNSRVDSWEDVREDWPVIARGRLRALHTRNASLFQRLQCPLLEQLSFPTTFELVGELSALHERTASNSPRIKHIVLGFNRASRDDVTRELLTRLNATCTTDLTIKCTSISIESVIPIIDFIAWHPHIFPNLLRLHVQLEHPRRMACDADDCPLMFGGRLGGALYEMHIRNSSIKVHTVSINVTCSDTTTPPCINKFFSDLMDLKPSGLTYELSTSPLGWEGRATTFLDD